MPQKVPGVRSNVSERCNSVTASSTVRMAVTNSNTAVSSCEILILKLHLRAFSSSPQARFSSFQTFSLEERSCFILLFQRMASDVSVDFFCSDKPSMKCPTGLRRCGKSQLCLPESTWCDGVADCPEEEDEKECHGECVRGAKVGRLFGGGGLFHNYSRF